MKNEDSKKINQNGDILKKIIYNIDYTLFTAPGSY